MEARAEVPQVCVARPAIWGRHWVAAFLVVDPARRDRPDQEICLIYYEHTMKCCTGSGRPPNGATFPIAKAV